MTLYAIVVLLGLLTIIAWASAWQTMRWLGDAEDLIESAASWRDLALLWDYKRRTPRRGR